VTAQRIGAVPEVRRRNLSDLLQHVHTGGAMRRAELTDLTGLNRSTIAGLVAELTTLGAVAETAAQPVPAGWPTKAGRPSPVVRPCPETVQVLAAAVAVGRISMALIGLGGTIMARCSRPVPDSSAGAMAALLGSISRELLASPRAGRVVGLGVALPGVIHRADGHVRFAPNLGWEDAPFGDLLRADLAARGIAGLPVRVGNDGDLGVLAEHRRGVARGVDDVVFVEGEVGVGCGVIVGGRPLVGAGGYAGELGHMKIRRGGRVCRCGSHGCWETEIGTEAMARALGLPEDADHASVQIRLRAGGPEQTVQLDGVARYLGVGLANVVNVLNPQLVVLGGLLRDLYPLVATRVGRTLAASALRAPLEQVTFAMPELGGDAVLLGAGESALQDVLADPAKVLG
jgi:predicted NBD/HSP70 family sugar kinase